MYKGYIYRHWLENKSYIGQTYMETPQQRWQNGRGYSNGNTKFSKAIKKHGWDSFGHEVLLAFECETKEELVFWLNQWEIYYIEKYDSFNNGYNSTTGGDNYICSDEAFDDVRRQVVCLNTGEVFRSIVEAGNWVCKYGQRPEDMVTAISRCCRNFEGYKARFKHPDTGEKLVWAWLHEYEAMSKEEIIEKIKDAEIYGKGIDIVALEENIAYKQDGIDIASLDYALRFLNANQLYIFKAVMLQEKTLEEVAKEIGKRKESVGRTYKEVIKLIQQRFTVAQFKEIITLN